MASRSDYRDSLNNKIVAIEDSGYGDFEFSTDELDTYLDLAVSDLFPALYKIVSDDALTVEEYGTNGYGAVDVTFPSRVFLVEDDDEKEPVLGWQARPTSIVKIDTNLYTTVNAYYYDAYTLADDDDTDAEISSEWTPIIVLGALIQALESRQDSGVRGDPGVGVQQLHETTLLDRLVARYNKTVEERALALPVVMV